MTVKGGFLIDPEAHEDNRGYFLEAMRTDLLTAVSGQAFELAQMNISMSKQGTLRGIHATTSPDGQSKYVTCVVGSIIDVIVDLSFDSPTFGKWALAELDSANGTSVFVPPWAGHGFLAVSPIAKVVYLTSSPYEPGLEVVIDALDHDLAIPWPSDHAFVRSSRDCEGQSFASYRRALESRARFRTGDEQGAP